MTSNNELKPCPFCGSQAGPLRHRARETKMTECDSEERMFDPTALHRWVAENVMGWWQEPVQRVSPLGVDMYWHDKENRPIQGLSRHAGTTEPIFKDSSILQVVRKMEVDGYLWTSGKWAGGGYFFSALNILGQDVVTVGSDDLITAITLAAREAKRNEAKQNER